MVFEDLFSPQNERKNNNSHPGSQLNQIASPVDRLAAFVGELPVFVPLLSVFLAPFRHDISVAQFMGSQVQSSFAFLGMAFTGAATLIAYQTLCIYFFGATPGKFFVGLRVVSIHDGQKPSFVMSLLRSISIFLEFLLLGFPWLASLSHPQRRVLHDRLSDTYVKCLDEKKAAVAPLFVERQLAKNIQAPGWAILLLAITIGLNYFNVERLALKVVKEFENNQQLCLAVSSAAKNWHSNIDPKASRIAIALALYEAQSIDENCLEKEAHFSLWRNQDKDFGYLALALTHSGDDKVFAEYIEKLCALNHDGEACKFALEIEGEREINSVEVRMPASQDGRARYAPPPDLHHDFMRLHRERQLHERNQLTQALELIDKSSATPNFADFLNLERLKIMWEMDRMLEARAAFQASRAHLTGPARIQLSSWMCSAEILNGCGQQSQLACSDFVADYDAIEIEPQPEWIELNYIRAQKCLSSDAMDYISIASKLNSERALDYLSALELVGDRKFNGARDIFKRIADQTESEEFQTQATADLVRLSKTSFELDYFFEEFTSKSNYRSDPNFAFELLHKYLSIGDFEKLSLVGASLIQIFPYKTSLYAILLNEAKKQKKIKFAKKLRAQFKKFMPNSKTLDIESEKI